MLKPGIPFDELEPLLANARSGWSLCVGAGTSLPVFPNWDRLVESLMARVVPHATPEDASALQQIFSPDALIQAARARMGGEARGFSQILSEQLYASFLESLSDGERATVADCLGADQPAELSRSQWARFLDIAAKRQWTSASAYAIADIIQTTLGTSLQPAGILSFNAEPLLLAFLHALEAKRSKGDPSRRIDRITHAASNRTGGRLPYVFCHGLLPVPGRAPDRGDAALDKLVFSESDYLALAGSAFSWQASAFFEMSLHRRVVFAGVSLSDANMRRWLAAIHTNRIDELKARGPVATSTQHLWLHVEPERARREWIEASVAHLGVRLVWLPAWNLIGTALARLLGLDASAPTADRSD